MIGLQYGQFDLTAVVMQIQGPAQFVDFHAYTRFNIVNDRKVIQLCIIPSFLQGPFFIHSLPQFGLLPFPTH